jgi:hypothetical protein
MSLSTIFQLYRVGFNCGGNGSTQEKTTDLPQFTDKLYLLNYRNHFLWDSENPVILSVPDEGYLERT